jgi:hypothetical protein
MCTEARPAGYLVGESPRRLSFSVTSRRSPRTAVLQSYSIAKRHLSESARLFDELREIVEVYGALARRRFGKRGFRNLQRSNQRLHERSIC